MTKEVIDLLKAIKARTELDSDTIELALPALSDIRADAERALILIGGADDNPVVLAVGTPFNGISLVGPFAAEDEARYYAANRDLGGEPSESIEIEPPE